MENEPFTPRRSKFTEGTMNSTASIHPPPDALYLGLDIEDVIRKANAMEDNNEDSHTRSMAIPAPSTSTTASESIFGRFSRAATSFFRGTGFGGLGKRKREANTEANSGVKRYDGDSKVEVERRYAEAKAMGILPTPQVFTRPIAKPRPSTAVRIPSSTPSDASSLPSTVNKPTLRTSTSKRDLHKQHKLSKKVSDLQFKLTKAQQELDRALNKQSDPATPALPSTPVALPPTPSTSASIESQLLNLEEPSIQHQARKIIKKRKANHGFNEDEFRPVPTSSEGEVDLDGSERSNKKAKSNRRASPNSRDTQKLRKKSSRVLKKKKSNIKEEKVVVLVPDGVTVPPIPSIPLGMEGKRAKVTEDDGFGGYGDEIF